MNGGCFSDLREEVSMNIKGINVLVMGVFVGIGCVMVIILV